MKKIIIISLVSLSAIMATAQNKKEQRVVLKAKCDELLESTTQVRYGTPLCVEITGINNFFTKTFAIYTPINFDFNTKTFQEINPSQPEPKNKEINAPEMEMNSLTKKLFQKDYQIYAFNKEIETIEFQKSGKLSDSIYNKKILALNRQIQQLELKKVEFENKIKSLIKKNKSLQQKFDSIYNVTSKSKEFISEFKNFQKHFSTINNYTSLKEKLLNLIRKDSVFICNPENFKARCSSTYVSIYNSNNDYLQDKNRFQQEIASLEEAYIKLVSLYQQINKLYKNSELKLSGELKDAKTVLKFNDIKASIETKYLFEEEMKKIKAIYDALLNTENNKKMSNEIYEGIDLYDEILNNDFKKTIVSPYIYDDIAEITPQLKNAKGKVVFEYQKLKVNVYGNIKINGSAGYFLNFIQEDNYSLRKKINTNPNSKNGVDSASRNTIKHALGGLLHAYYNAKGSVDYGLSVGLSINDSANAGFYLGLSGFFTEKNRLVVTSGLSFVKVKRINTANLTTNTLTNQLDFLNEEDTEIRYEDVYKPSLFVGISYNLF